MIDIKLVEDVKQWAYINSRENEISQPLLSMLRTQEKAIQAKVERELTLADDVIIGLENTIRRLKDEAKGFRITDTKDTGKEKDNE